MVQLEHGRGGSFIVRRAAAVNLPDAFLNPSFHDSNIPNPAEMGLALRDLATSAGLLQQKKWSVSLPDAASRTLILTLESRPASRAELEEILTWKMERGFGSPLEELSISRERLPADAHGRDRYMVVATPAFVLAQYEEVLRMLGWRAGLIVPRHVGEGQWLQLNGARGDSLLLSSSANAFTAVVFRGKQPLIVRTVECDAAECEDELHRLLLFYRDRRATETPETNYVSRLLILGNLLTKQRAREIVIESLETDLPVLDAGDVGLQLATRELSFDSIAAPAGLATLAWQ